MKDEAATHVRRITASGNEETQSETLHWYMRASVHSALTKPAPGVSSATHSKPPLSRGCKRPHA